MANFVSPFEKWGRRRGRFRLSWHYSEMSTRIHIFWKKGPREFEFTVQKKSPFLHANEKNYIYLTSEILLPHYVSVFFLCHHIKSCNLVLYRMYQSVGFFKVVFSPSAGHCGWGSLLDSGSYRIKLVTVDRQHD